MLGTVYDGDALYRGNAIQDAPDLVVGYRPGYRASRQTTLGSVPGSLIDNNARKCSGDHCIAPEHVLGVLFTSLQLESPVEDITTISQYVRKHWRSDP